MFRICVVAHALRPPEGGSAGSVSERAWNIARRLRSWGHEVTLLYTDLNAAASVRTLAAAARDARVGFCAACESPPPFDVPIFPTGAVHAAAHRVSSALKALEPDVCLVLDEPALVSISITSRRTGVAFATTRFVVMAETLPRELARLRQVDLPKSGREEIVHDFLERRAISGADELISSDPKVVAAIIEAGFAPPVPPLSMRWFEAGDEPSPSASWTAVVRPGSIPQPVKPVPRISVCMPYHEQPAFLPEALRTLAEQTLTPHEVLVMDDGSRSRSALDEFSAAEARYASRGWKFLRQENAGPAAARNRLADAAAGDAILFCDSDNRFRPEMIAAVSHTMALTAVDCVTCGFQAFRTTSDAAKEDPGYIFMPLGPCAELALVENVLGDTNFLVRRDVFRQLAGFPEANRVASEDWQFLLQLLRAGRKLETVPAVLFDYRLAPGSHARSHSEFASATAAIRSYLDSTDAAWRRLWPHLVAAIRNPQVPRLEGELQALRLEHQAELARVNSEVESLEHALTLARRSIRRRQWEVFVRQAALDRFRISAETAEAERDRQASCAAELKVRVAEIERERNESVARRDDKIRRMQSAWSWRATAPFRTIRRTLFDRRRSTVPREPGERRAVKSAIDTPAFWDAAPCVGAISGWCLIDGREPPRSVRTILEEARLPGEHSLPREDVIRAHALPPAALRCGFSFRYRLQPDTASKVRVEAERAPGEWEILREETLRTSAVPREANDYRAWIQAFDTMTPERETALRNRLAELPDGRRPLISVVMPVHNPAERWLARAIESVREQVYANWELCIADDASTAGHVRELLDNAQTADPRIQVVYRPDNGHISAASNSALAVARGEFVALLDHDDELAADALAEVVLLLSEHPDADLVFSDEDKIDEDGRRSTPYFKPDYLPDLLLGQNCLSHLSIYRTQRVRQVGGFREGYEGSQDWDLALRVVERTTPDRVRHLPKVLYHWRAVGGSTAVAVNAKQYSVDSARRALVDHFARCGIAAEVRPVPGDHWRVVYPRPDPAPLVSIIVPTRNESALLKTCIGSILARTEYPNFEVVVVDNGTDEPGTLALLEEFAREDNVTVIDYDAPFNYSAINNFAARRSRGDVLCFLNNDVEVITGLWLDELVANALRPEIGAVGPMLYYPNGLIQHAGVVLGLGGVANHAFLNYPHGTDGYMNRARLAQNYSAVTGACLVVRRGVFEKAGGFNERDLPVAFNDVDFCLRVRAAGFLNLWTPFAELFHYESASRGNDDTPEKRARFASEVEYMRRTWGTLLDRDPAYNPNLSVSLLGWSLAWPPRT